MLNSILQAILLLTTGAVFGLTVGKRMQKRKLGQSGEKLKNKLQRSAQALTPIGATLTQVEIDITTREKTLIDLQNKCEALRSEQIATPIDIAELTARASQSESASYAVRSSAVDNDEVLARLRDELSEERAALREINQELSQTQANHTVQTRCLAKIETQLVEHKSAANRAHAESSTLQSKINLLQISLNDNKNSETESTEAQSNNNHESLEDKIEKLKKELHQKVTHAKITDNLKRQLHSEIDSFETSVRDLEATANTLRKEMQKTEPKHKDSIARFHQRFAQNADTLNQPNELKQQIKVLSRANTLLQETSIKTAKKSDQKIASLTLAVDSAKKNTKELENNTRNIQEQLENCLSTITALRSEAAIVEKERSELLDQLNEKESKSAAQQRAYQQATERSAKWEVHSAEQKTLIKELRKRIESADLSNEKAAHKLEGYKQLKSENKKIKTQIADLDLLLEQAIADKAELQRESTNTNNPRPVQKIKQHQTEPNIGDSIGLVKTPSTTTTPKSKIK